MIKYTHLVANLMIFHTIVGMMKALDVTRADGLGDAITDEALAGLSLGCPVCAHFVHYTSCRNRVPPRRGFRVEVQ